MPVEARYASAFFATLRGSREYCSPVIGSWMKKLMLTVLSRRKGSTRAVDRSARSAMSDSWMAWKPRIEEPSKASSSSGSKAFMRQREVLHHTRQIAESDVDELDVLVRDELLGLVGVLEHPLLLLPTVRAGVVVRSCGQCGGTRWTRP